MQDIAPEAVPDPQNVSAHSIKQQSNEDQRQNDEISNVFDDGCDMDTAEQMVKIIFSVFLFDLGHFWTFLIHFCAFFSISVNSWFMLMCNV